MKNYKIAVAGTGYVGLSLGVLFAQHHQVVAVDIVQAKVDMINNKKSPIQDDYIEKYLAEKDLNLTATLDAKAACPYIEYKIQGISGIVAKEEKSFCVKDDLIIQIELKQEGLEITGLKVLLKEDSVIDEQVKQTIRRKIERFLVNLYGNPNVYVSKFSMGILQIFNPNSKKAQYEFSSTLVISAECSCAIQCNADYFKEMYEKQVPEDKADEVYPLLFSTMRIDDIFVRYLMQYEILLGQVTNEHTQKEVTDYIKKVYNPANKDRQIGFQLTRRPRRKYKEDDLTYNRNLLGHGDIEKAVSEEKIRQLSRSIMDVLWFSLWNKAE